jgi:hypothetical protein
MHTRALAELLPRLAKRRRAPVLGAVAAAEVTARERFEAEEKHRRAMRLFYAASGLAAVAGMFFTWRRIQQIEDRLDHERR